jgi:hypothetical protein
MALASLNPTASITLSAGKVSTAVAIPTTGSPTTAVVTNILAPGNETGNVAFLQMGTSSAVQASDLTSYAVLAGQSVALTIGSNTYIAAVTQFGETQLNITVGT